MRPQHRKHGVRALELGSFLIALGASCGCQQAPREPAEGTPVERNEPRRGPELIREFFADWHEPFPADLDRTTLERIWSQIERVPEEAPRLGRGLAPGWVPYGPFGMTHPGGGRFSGRVLDLALVGSELRAAAAASGGLWVRDPGGWQPRSDALPTLWSGSFTLRASDPGTILLGTGEPFLRAGMGLWKTTNGGDSWTRRALSPEPATCFRIRHAISGNVVHGAFDLGYYRSTNGGESWTRPFAPGDWPTDLALHPTDPNRLFLTVWGQGLFRSTNGGSSWSEVIATGLPQTNLGRGALTICRNDPARMYVAWSHSGTNNLLGLWKTTNAGTTWSEVSPPEYMWGQGWYNNTVAVSPLDPDLVLAGGGGVMRTSNGGSTWEVVSDPHLHADCHASVWTDDGQQVWIGHDGGISVSADGGVTWDSTDNLLPITQYVAIGASAFELPLVAGGGSQDNGMSITTDGGVTWSFRIGGDGGGLAIDPFHPERMFCTVGVYGGAWPFRRHRSTDHGVTWTFMDGGIGLASQWFLRIRSDLASPQTLYTYGNQFVYQSVADVIWTAMTPNPGLPHWVSELTVSRVGTEGSTIYACLDSAVDEERLRVWNGSTFEERSAGLPSGTRVRKIAPHPRDPEVAYAIMNGLGNAGAKLFRTTDRGLTWSNRSGDLPDVPVSDLMAHPTDPNRLYLSSEMGCFRTTNGGVNWERWQLGLPDATVVTELTFVDRLEAEGRFVIVAGTYGRGLWVRDTDTDDDTTGLPDGATPAPDREPDRALARSIAIEAAPNPFRDGTSLLFELPEPLTVTLRIVDVEGRECLRVLDQAALRSGRHRITLYGGRLGPGVFFAELQAGKHSSRQRLIRL